MRKFLLFIASLFIVGSAAAQKNSYKENARQYIEQYRQLAMEEQQRVGIPAAITLGQGILETQAGQSELATQAHNHFGIKCKKEWTGETFAHTDDAPNECFRKYPNDLASYRDHSDYLKNSKRYLPCFACAPNDYASWAKALRRCGYATNPNYANQLIKIIEDFQLQQYTFAANASPQPILVASLDSPVAAAAMIEQARAGEIIPEQDAPNPASTPDEPEYGVLVKRNGIRGFYAHKHDVLLEYAIKYKMRYAKLLEINKLPDAPLAADQFIAIERGGSTITNILSKDASEPEVAPVLTNATTQAHPVIAAAPVEKAKETEEVETRPGTAVVAEEKVTPVEEQAKPVTTAPAVVAQAKAAEVPVNIANEKAVEEMPVVKTAEPVKPEEPQDEFSRMKARFDRVVYSGPKTETKAAQQAQTTAAPETPVTTTSAAATPPTKQYHVVSKGETAFGIAKKYGISMTELMKLNNMNFESIKLGQKLRVR